jgi:hypothetical protein
VALIEREVAETGNKTAAVKGPIVRYLRFDPCSTASIVSL